MTGRDRAHDGESDARQSSASRSDGRASSRAAIAYRLRRARKGAEASAVRDQVRFALIGASPT